MKITIEIDEEELNKAIECVIIQNAVKQIENDLYNDGYGYNRRIYRDEIKNAVRSVIRENKDDLEKRAVEAAAYTISHKALKEKSSTFFQTTKIAAKQGHTRPESFAAGSEQKKISKIFLRSMLQDKRPDPITGQRRTL